VLIDEILKGAKRLSQAEVALQTGNETQKEIFDKAGPEIEFAGWSWDPHKLDAPKNTPAPKEDCKIKQRLVYLSADIFGDNNIREDEEEKIIQVMRESPQWIFMVHTSELERLAEIDWPKNVWIGCIVHSQEYSEKVVKVFIEIR
jgi:protein gp37